MNTDHRIAGQVGADRVVCGCGECFTTRSGRLRRDDPDAFDMWRRHMRHQLRAEMADTSGPND